MTSMRLATLSAFSAELWNGEWEWVAEEAKFADKDRHNKAQRQLVRVVDQQMTMQTYVTLLDGSEVYWQWEGAFDGKPRPIELGDGSVMAQMAFMLLRDGHGADSYFAPDGSKTGAEYFTIDARALRVWGCYTKADGKQYPYHETWRRTA
jgi:hypothetical protein